MLEKAFPEPEDITTGNDRATKSIGVTPQNLIHRYERKSRKARHRGICGRSSSTEGGLGERRDTFAFRAMHMRWRNSA